MLSTRSVARILGNRSLTALVVVFLYIIASLVWSSEVALSAKRLVRALGDPIMVLLIATEDDPAESCKIIVIRTAYLLVPMSIVLVKYFPLWGRSYNWEGDKVLWEGVASNKNSLGMYLAFVLLFLTAEWEPIWKAN